MSDAASIIIKFSGQVKYKRDRWLDYQPVKPYTELFPGDLIQVPPGATALIECAIGNLWRVPEGVSGLNNGCQPMDDNGGGGTRPVNDDLTPIPFVISPRSTLLLADKPALRWNAVSGASSYIVSVSDETNGSEIWKAEVSSTEIVYPGTSSLEPGVDYLVIVKADNAKSSEEDKEVDLAFRLIDKNESQRILAHVEQIQQELSGEAADLAVVHLYGTSKLKAEAIEMLEVLAQKGSQTTAIYRMLGDLYWQVKLHHLSESPYKKAIQLAEVNQDIEVKAVAQARLAELYEARGQWIEAISWGTAAKLDYETLGDTQRVSELTQKLEQWNKRI
ncbi:tetratricopeptide repeat protein [Scytonema sp. NUACC26]|uniref:tetratricopeptide repeat protein n=1 Tax=Scytonema sp. NUACC26 TaxID=3140176 RepID=UPI0034DC5E70